MAKQTHRLTALQVKKLSKPGWYPDGAGLYLQVSNSNSKSWVYRYEKAGKERRHGPTSGVSSAVRHASGRPQMKNKPGVARPNSATSGKQNNPRP